MNFGYFLKESVALGIKKTINTDNKTNEQPLTINLYDNTYTLVYSGNIYNKEELKKHLIEKGFAPSNLSDAEILLKAFICYGYDVVNKLNGVFSFAIWNESKQELYLARDHFGIKPLYYTFINNTLIFSSDIKSILKFPEVKTEVDVNGISELFGLGPAHTPGTAVFKNIHELKPAHYAIFNKSNLYIKQYWKLESRLHIDNFETTCDTIQFLLEDSIQKQVNSESPLCSMLSRRN